MFRSKAVRALGLVAVLSPLCLHAQFSSGDSNFLARSNTLQPPSFDLPLYSAPPDLTPAKPKPRLAAITTGWSYIWTDEGGYRINLNGWFLRPSVNFGKGYSVFFDSTNYYATNRKGSLNSHGFTAGIGRQFFAKAKVKPSLFAESGDVRSSGAGTITNQFAFATGFGLSIPLNQHVELALTPAEYIFLYPNSTVRNDYNAKVGLSFPFGRR